MMDGYRIIVFSALLFSIGAVLIFIWAVKSGYFKDVEEPKYRMMEEDDR